MKYLYTYVETLFSFNRAYKHRTFPPNFDAKHRIASHSREQKRLPRRLPTRIVATGWLAPLRVFVTRAGDPPLLSLSFFSSLWRMLFNAATTVRHVSEKEGEEGASAWAGGQSYRGGWLASVNGFRGQWREISRPVSQELWTRLLRLVPWTRGGSPFRSRPLALADDLESRQKRKKGHG